MHDEELAMSSRLPAQRRQLIWGGLGWIVLIAGVALWQDMTKVEAYEREVQSNASRTLDAAQQNVNAAFGQLAALAGMLAEQGRFADFMDKVAVLAPAGSVPSQQMRQQLMDAPQVLSMNQALDAVVQDFLIQQALLIDRSAHVVADSAYRNTTTGVLGANLATHPVFVEAVQQGSGFAFSSLAPRQPPGFNVSARLSPQGQSPGLLLLRLEPESLVRLLGDTGGTAILLTDQQGVVVAGSRDVHDQGQQVPMPARGTDDEAPGAAATGSRLPWSLGTIKVAEQTVRVVGIDGVDHLALSRPLPRHPYTAWVLAPLDGIRLIHATTAGGAGAAILLGLVVLSLAWQRLERIRITEQARRTALETMQSLPLAVYRYRIAPNAAGYFSYLGQDAPSLLAMDEATLNDQAGLLWKRMGLSDGKPSTEPVTFDIDTPGGKHWLRSQARASVRPDGTEVFDGYWQDITAWRRSELRFESLYEHVPVGIVFFQREDGILRCNRAALRIFGATSIDALKGLHPWRTPLSPSHQSGDRHSETQARLMLEQQQASRVPLQMEWRHSRLDGTRFDAAVTLLSFEHEGPGVMLAIIDDITARKQTEEALRLASESASANARAKTAFLSNMSHEIRTPMNAVIGMTHLALTDPHPDKLKAYVSKAHQAAKSLLQIINDILDLSRIEAGQMELECIEFSLQGVIDQLADVLGLQAEQKGLELLFTAPPDLPTHLLGDPTRLRQILLNLGSNAIKFTEHGSVTLGLEVQSRRGYEVVLHGWVRDTGIGIDREQQSLLFTPFNQVDSSTTRRFGGSGLGLSICRQLLERMGGQLWVDSSLGQGATFHFTMKTDLPAGQTGQAVLLHDWTGKRALLADDNADAREVLGKMLSSLGVEVHSVANGNQALAALAKADKPYDWVLLDWKMPQMDGVQCAQLIDRQVQQQFPQSHPCILLVTAFNREDALEAAEGVPLADVLTKPVTPATLFESLKRTYVVKPMVSQAPPEDEPSIPTDLLLDTRILLVEDQPLNQELARDLMELAGATVVCAENGAQALTALAREGPFDCVLMDCQMPVMDGYTATLKIRSQPQWQQLPIIAMTASALSTDREHALNSGMNDHIAKPLDVQQTYQVVSKWINASRALQREARAHLAAPGDPVKKDPRSPT